MVRIILPHHLRTLSQVTTEVELEVSGQVSVSTVLDALERRFPVLTGTIREHETHKRRPFLRFFACGEDISLESPELALPEVVASGKEPFLIVGAIAGG